MQTNTNITGAPAASPYDEYLASLPGANYLVVGLDGALQTLWSVNRTVPGLKVNINEALEALLDGLNDHESPFDYIDELMDRIQDLCQCPRTRLAWRQIDYELLLSALKRFFLQVYFQLCQASGTEDGVVTYRLHSWFDPVSVVLEKCLETGFETKQLELDRIIVSY